MVEENRLYGRGCSDDGYALYAALLSVKGIQTLGLSHPRVLVAIEADEESGSSHIDAYLGHLKTPLANVNYVVCLDSAALDYSHLWVITSLRGNLSAKLSVSVLSQGVHSGLASGVVPSSFRVLRQLLSRIEDPSTGEIVPQFQVPVPPERLRELRKNAALLGMTAF